MVRVQVSSETRKINCRIVTACREGVGSLCPTTGRSNVNFFLCFEVTLHFEAINTTMKMKLCSKCGEEKPLTSFNWKLKSKKIRQSACKECSRAEGKSHYRHNKVRVIEQTISRKRAYNKVLLEWKCSLFCVECNENDSSCIDFHHPNPEEKEQTVSSLISSGSLTKAKKEIAKCVVLCSNCHRKHHAGKLKITSKHIKTSQKLTNTVHALISPLASNQ